MGRPSPPQCAHWGTSPKGGGFKWRNQVILCVAPPLGELSPPKAVTERAFAQEVIMTVPKNGQMLPRARELRRNMTPQEKKLWYQFLRKYPVKIYKQRIIESFIVDFYCAPAKLVIELDGSQHYTEQGEAYDAERSACLARYELEVIRFTNSEIDTEFDAVCRKIHTVIQERQE